MASEEEKRPFLQRPMPRILVFGGSSLVLLLGLSLALLKIVFGNVPLTKIIEVLLNGAQLSAQDSPVRGQGRLHRGLRPPSVGRLTLKVVSIWHQMFLTLNIFISLKHSIKIKKADTPMIVPANKGWLITFNDCAARGCQSEDDGYQHDDFALELCSNAACDATQAPDPAGSVYLVQQHGDQSSNELTNTINYYDRKPQCLGGTDVAPDSCNKIMHFFIVIDKLKLKDAPATHLWHTGLIWYL